VRLSPAGVLVGWPGQCAALFWGVGPRVLQHSECTELVAASQVIAAVTTCCSNSCTFNIRPSISINGFDYDYYEWFSIAIVAFGRVPPSALHPQQPQRRLPRGVSLRFVA
jgi:hypothetical protein